MTDQIQKRDIVVRQEDAERKQPRGIVIATFTITAQQMEGLLSTPVEPGNYAVVTWHGRMSLRAERADDLRKVAGLA